MRRFEFVEGSSSKFWEIDVKGKSVVVRFGRLGSDGQEKLKACASPAAASDEAAKLVKEKLAKGYREVTASAGAKASAVGAKKRAPAGAAPVKPGKATKPTKAAKGTIEIRTTGNPWSLAGPTASIPLVYAAKRTREPDCIDRVTAEYRIDASRFLDPGDLAPIERKGDPKKWRVIFDTNTHDAYDGTGSRVSEGGVMAVTLMRAAIAHVGGSDTPDAVFARLAQCSTFEEGFRITMTEERYDDE